MRDITLSANQYHQSIAPFSNTCWSLGRHIKLSAIHSKLDKQQNSWYKVELYLFWAHCWGKKTDDRNAVCLLYFFSFLLLLSTSLVGGCFTQQCTKSQSLPPAFVLCLSRSSFLLTQIGVKTFGAVLYLYSLLSRLATCLHAPPRTENSPRINPDRWIKLPTVRSLRSLPFSVSLYHSPFISQRPHSRSLSRSLSLSFSLSHSLTHSGRITMSKRDPGWIAVERIMTWNFLKRGWQTPQSRIIGLHPPPPSHIPSIHSLKWAVALWFIIHIILNMLPIAYYFKHVFLVRVINQ